MSEFLPNIILQYHFQVVERGFTVNILERMKLTDKKIFVTGGARGIGLALATAVAEAGADVALVDVDLALATDLAKKLSVDTGRQVIALGCDVTSPTDVDRMMADFLATFGRVDAAFCNAGICINQPAEEMTYENFKKVMDINLNGVFLTNIAAGKAMLQQGTGSIINTASMSGHIVNVPQPQCAYNASKAAVIQLTKSLAIEWADRGVRVNSISPGYIATDMTLQSPLVPQWNALSPVGRLGTPAELQGIAVYLAGDTSSFTTGSDFLIDGGFSSF